MMITKGKKAIRPPAPAPWAIKDKFSGEDNKDIAATPSSHYNNHFADCRGQNGSATLDSSIRDGTTKFTAYIARRTPTAQASSASLPTSLLQDSPASMRAWNSEENSASSPNAIACRILFIMSRKNATLWWEFRMQARISLA